MKYYKADIVLVTIIALFCICVIIGIYRDCHTKEYLCLNAMEQNIIHQMNDKNAIESFDRLLEINKRKRILLGAESYHGH